MNAIIARRLGDPEGTEYIKPDPAMLTKIEFPQDETSIEETAAALAANILKIMGLSSD